MKKSLLSISVILMVSLLLGCTNSDSSPSDAAADTGIDEASQDIAIPSWVIWLADHWGADAETWVEMAGSSDGGDIEWWLRSSDLYGDSAKTWNHVSAAYSIEPVAIPTDCDRLDNAEDRKQLAEAFASRLMSGLCEKNELWSFQITEYIISKTATEKSIRYEPEEEEIWVRYFWADFKFDGLISPIAWGNTGDFVGDDSFGMYEMVLEDGNCVFYPVYSDNRQRVVQ